MPVLSATSLHMGFGGLIPYLLPSSIILILITYVLKRRKTQLQSLPQLHQDVASTSEKSYLLTSQPQAPTYQKLHTLHLLQTHPRPQVQIVQTQNKLPYPDSPPLQARDFFPPPPPRPLLTTGFVPPYPLAQALEGSDFTSSPTTYLPMPQQLPFSPNTSLPFSADSPNPSSFTSDDFTEELTEDKNISRGTPSYPPPTASTYKPPFSSSYPPPELPRRRSYTKTLSFSSTTSAAPYPSSTTTGTPASNFIKEASLTGEIISGEGWRRHTRVYGGGVCVACEESQGRLRVLEALKEKKDVTS